MKIGFNKEKYMMKIQAGRMQEMKILVYGIKSSAEAFIIDPSMWRLEYQGWKIGEGIHPVKVKDKF